MGRQTMATGMRTKTIVSATVFWGIVAVLWGLVSKGALAQSGDVVRGVAESATSANWAFGAAAAAVAIGSLSAGIAVAYVGAAAIGAISEKPELTGKVLIFVGLAEGIAIYGLIIAIMILGKVA